MGIERTSARRVKAVERELDRILARRDTLLYQAMRYTVLGGGKRFRPVFCLLTAAALAAGGDQINRAPRPGPSIDGEVKGVIPKPGEGSPLMGPERLPFKKRGSLTSFGMTTCLLYNQYLRL